MKGDEGRPINPPPDRLIERWVYFVNVTSFTFEFESVEHLRECLNFFRHKIHPSSRDKIIPWEHYWQRWYERLPQWLFEEPKRVKVVRALERAEKAFPDSAAA